MQVPKKHLPFVGLLGLIVIVAAGGGIYYYQFVIPHITVTYTPVHRLVIMTAIIFEESGFHVNDTAYLNQSSLPPFDSTNGANLTRVEYQNYPGNSDNRTVEARVGDKITFYIKGLPTKDPMLQDSTGHGFEISGPAPVTVNAGGPEPCSTSPPPCIPFNTWYTVTVTFNASGSYRYFCTLFCSPQHGLMDGNIVVT